MHDKIEGTCDCCFLSKKLISKFCVFSVNENKENAACDKTSTCNLFIKLPFFEAKINRIQFI